MDKHTHTHIRYKIISHIVQQKPNPIHQEQFHSKKNNYNVPKRLTTLTKSFIKEFMNTTSWSLKQRLIKSFQKANLLNKRVILTSLALICFTTTLFKYVKRQKWYYLTLIACENILKFFKNCIMPKRDTNKPRKIMCILRKQNDTFLALGPTHLLF